MVEEFESRMTMVLPALGVMATDADIWIALCQPLGLGGGIVGVDVVAETPEFTQLLDGEGEW